MSDEAEGPPTYRLDNSGDAPIVDALHAGAQTGQTDADTLVRALWASTLHVPCVDDPPELCVKTTQELGTWLCAYTSPERLAVGEGIVEDDPNYTYLTLSGAQLFDSLLLNQGALPAHGVWINLGSDGEQMSVPLAALANYLASAKERSAGQEDDR